MEYIILWGRTEYDLISVVQEAITEHGWVPQGGVSVDNTGVLFQAMIRRPDEVVDVPDGD